MISAVLQFWSTTHMLFNIDSFKALLALGNFFFNYTSLTKNTRIFMFEKQILRKRLCAASRTMSACKSYVINHCFHNRIGIDWSCGLIFILWTGFLLYHPVVKATLAVNLILALTALDRNLKGTDNLHA